MERIWKYIEIQFISATRNNSKKAVKLSYYHDAGLYIAQTHEPSLVPIYARYHPVHEQLKQKYNELKSAEGSQKGQTANVNQLLETTVEKVDNWDARIKTVYAKGSPRYIAIFPSGRKPFTQGSLDDRINAFNTLGLNIGADINPVIASVKTEVDADYTLLDTARNTQEGAKVTARADSSFLEEAVTNAMNMQYRDLGFVMDNFFDNLEGMANALFDQQTLRVHQQTLYTGALAESENKPVLLHTFLSDDELEIELTCTGPVPATANIAFYLATTSGGTDSTAVHLTVNTGKHIITAEQFGITEYGTHRHLTVVNSSTFDLTYTVKIK